MPSKIIPPKKGENRPSSCLTAKPARQPEQSVKCPRCDSMNTKFCYYNNHSLTQPRYFCKGCRRYWTKGGALRTIPFGGGYGRRKIAKSFTSKFVTENDHSTANGLELFQGFNMDFQLATPPSVFSNSSMGQELNFTLSSIESMSSINQDLYWKLQQQRLNLLFGGQNNINTQKEDTSFISYFPLQNDDYTPNKSYDEVANYCSPSEGYDGNFATEWLFESSYASVDPVAVNNCGNNRGIIECTSSWNNGMQGWSDFNQCGLIMP